MITLDGLSKAQVAMCDLLWDIDDINEMELFLDTLDAANKKMAMTLIQMIVLADIDQQVNSMEEYPDARQLLNSIGKGTA